LFFIKVSTVVRLVFASANGRQTPPLAIAIDPQNENPAERPETGEVHSFQPFTKVSVGCNRDVHKNVCGVIDQVKYIEPYKSYLYSFQGADRIGTLKLFQKKILL
jgi:hypothetical protein